MHVLILTGVCVDVRRLFILIAPGNQFAAAFLRLHLCDGNFDAAHGFPLILMEVQRCSDNQDVAVDLWLRVCLSDAMLAFQINDLLDNKMLMLRTGFH
jgi:hypothetical protein